MALPKIIVALVCCTYIVRASEHSHIIPVEGYEGKLVDLGSHVEYHKPPVKVIKITKTVAVKVPVPYPVKIIQKVPYPVHINKPYPVPVPQLVHVPHVVHAKDSGSGQHGGGNSGSSHHFTPPQENTYHVQEQSSEGHHESEQSPLHSFGGGGGSSLGEHSFLPSQEGQSYHGNEDGGYNFGTSGNDHLNEDFSDKGHYGPSSNEGESEESISYHRAINEYIKTHQQNNGGNSGHH